MDSDPQADILFNSPVTDGPVTLFGDSGKAEKAWKHGLDRLWISAGDFSLSAELQ